jgi:hypothetical protein
MMKGDSWECLVEATIKQPISVMTDLCNDGSEQGQWHTGIASSLSCSGARAGKGSETTAGVEGLVRIGVAVPEVVTTGEGTCNMKLPGDPSGPPDGARPLGGPDAPHVLE